MSTTKKINRKTRYTIYLIKETFLKLIDQESYSKITITQICKEADITRLTFYLHFNSLTNLLNEVIDDALYLSAKSYDISLIFSTEYLQNNQSLLPACQRVGDLPKYQNLLMDDDLSEYIIGRIMKHERVYVIPSIIEKTRLSKTTANSK